MANNIAFQLSADGTDITSAISDRVLSIRLSDESQAKTDTLEIQLDDRDQKTAVPAVGTYLSLSLDSGKSGMVPMGRYAITEVSFAAPPFTMTIRATGAGVAASLGASNSESWHETTVGDMAKKIAERNGLGLDCDREVSVRAVKHEDQTAESDLSFLTRVGNKMLFNVKVKDGKLVLSLKGKADKGKAIAL